VPVGLQGTETCILDAVSSEPIDRSLAFHQPKEVFFLKNVDIEGSMAMSILNLTEPPRSERVALFYPYIHFRNREWLRTAMLYYDQVSRIVPPGVDFDKVRYYREFSTDGALLLEDIAALRANGFLVEDSPEPYVASIASEFFDFAVEKLADEKKRAALVPRLAKRGDFYSVHRAKIDPTLSEMLVKLNLAREGRKRPSWSDLELEPVTGGLYMLFLARKMANHRNLVTDSPVYQSLLFQETGRAREGDTGDRFTRVLVDTFRK
jgi:hypothetical protein